MGRWVLLFLLGLGAAAAASDDPPALGLEVEGRAPGESALVMEPGPLTLRIHAPRDAWLCYQPDAGEIRRYFLGKLDAQPLFHWNLDTTTGGKLYVSTEDSAGQKISSSPLRVASGAYDALQRALSPDPRIRIEVNLPAFELALYRENELLRRFRVGIGVKAWPVPPGLRAAREIVWNPEWVPPNSPWATPGLVRSLRRRGEVLGRMKIPLGGEILIHGTSRPSDLGRLVSHGCLRMLNRDVTQLANLLVRETDTPVDAAKVKRAQRNLRYSYRAEFPRPIVVAIRYDPVVLRAGRVTVYRDVYGWAPVSPEQIAEAQQFVDPTIVLAKPSRPGARTRRAAGVGHRPAAAQSQQVTHRQ